MTAYWRHCYGAVEDGPTTRIVVVGGDKYVALTVVSVLRILSDLFCVE